MPDVFLIQPPIRDFYLTAKRTLPYGLARIAGALSAKGFSVDIFDALARGKSRNLPWPEEMAYLKDFFGRPDRSPFGLFHRFRHFGFSFEALGRAAKDSGAFLVGISALCTPYSGEALAAATVVRRQLPGAKIVLGGHHPTHFPEAVLDSQAVDFVLRGEGEASLPVLAETLRYGGDLRKVPGVAFRGPDGRVHANRPAVTPSPAATVLPANHLIDRSFYRRRKADQAVVVATRGCPFRCSYCSMGAASHLPYGRRPVKAVLQEIEAALEQGDLGFIDFEDENLSLDRDWFSHLLAGVRSLMGARPVELRAMNGLFPPTLDREIVQSMAAAGFRVLNLSLGATSAAQLKRFRRPDVREDFDRALAAAESCGLEAVGYILAGAPYQKAAQTVADLLFLARRRVLAGLSIFYPSPGSADYELCRQLSILPPAFSLMRSSCMPIDHSTTRIEAVTLLRLARILNFIKELADQGMPLPTPCGDSLHRLAPLDRRQNGLRLLQRFLNDGRIFGIAQDGTVYEHTTARHLTRQFLAGLQRVHLRGVKT